PFSWFPTVRIARPSSGHGFSTFGQFAYVAFRSRVTSEMGRELAGPLSGGALGGGSPAFFLFWRLIAMHPTSYVESPPSLLESHDFETEFLDLEGMPGPGSSRSCSPGSPWCIAADRLRVGHTALQHVAMKVRTRSTNRDGWN